ncbi:MAG: helix-turn-helix domain-containing protein [Anaerolineales bacterium]|nr:MAG: helix-turn-helix domain-containing protein [Anaerolineales bacterium]
MIKRVGRELRQAREAKSLSIEQVSREIRIRSRYLEAIEEGDLGTLPSAVHVRGFLRSYAEFLELNSDELLSALRQQTTRSSPYTQTPEVGQEDLTQNTFQQVEAIFEEIGSAMHSRRETLGLSLEDVEQHTHIPEHYAKMIENGEFTRFPSPVQARGMLSNYANFLEMDANAVLLRYADALQTRLSALQAAEQVAKPRKRTTKSRAPRLPRWLRNTLSPDMFIFGVIGVSIVLFTIWGIGRIINTSEALSPQPTARSLSDILLPSPTEAPTASATVPVTPTTAVIEVGENPEEEEAAEPTFPPFSQADIQIYIIVRQRAYLKVTVDGEVEFEGRALPGSNLPFTGQQQIEILTGNAAALQIFYNDQDMGTLGIFGEVINVIYTRDGVILPTALPTPTLPPEEQATPTATSEISLPEQENTPPP